MIDLIFQFKEVASVSDIYNLLLCFGWLVILVQLIRFIVWLFFGKGRF